MFTGIIEAVGRVERLEESEGGRKLTIACPFASELRDGESVAVNGACLTVTRRYRSAFEAFVIEETLSKTGFGDLAEGQSVNLERSMRADGRLDGHLVQGHVDATGSIESVEQLADSWMVTIRYPEEFAANLISVGSIAVDGISLTVARLDEESFAVAIIPHTWENTCAGDWKPSAKVNLEFDLLGKYVSRIMALRS